MQTEHWPSQFFATFFLMVWFYGFRRVRSHVRPESSGSVGGLNMTHMKYWPESCSSLVLCLTNGFNSILHGSQIHMSRWQFSLGQLITFESTKKLYMSFFRSESSFQGKSRLKAGSDSKTIVLCMAPCQCCDLMESPNTILVIHCGLKVPNVN